MPSWSSAFSSTLPTRFRLIAQSTRQGPCRILLGFVGRGVSRRFPRWRAPGTGRWQARSRSAPAARRARRAEAIPKTPRDPDPPHVTSVTRFPGSRSNRVTRRGQLEPRRPKVSLGVASSRRALYGPRVEPLILGARLRRVGLLSRNARFKMCLGALARLSLLRFRLSVGQSFHDNGVAKRRGRSLPGGCCGLTLFGNSS
jgi:hypothetical protein